jgi:DNA phosphorothioation-dependent restriction protein DptH
MSQGLRTVQPHDLAAELEQELFPRLAELLRSRGRGHCMRLTDLDSDLMVRLCGRLRAEVAEAQVVILDSGHSSTPRTLTVTSTKLVELRNPLPNGALRPPLLVFIPNDSRAAAEDSFGIATFENVPVGDVYARLRARLLGELPGAFRGAIAEGLRRLEGDESWPFAEPLAIVRFLLSAKLNGGDPEAIGAGLFELALVPDFELLNDATKAPARIGRNCDCVRTLTWSPRSERGRVLELGLKKGAFQTQLAELLADSGVEDPREWTRRIVLDRACWQFAFHRWELEESNDDQGHVFIGDVSVDLPQVGEEPGDAKLQELKAEEKILVVGKGGLRRFNVGFRVDPHPSHVAGLARFVAQVISKETGPVGLVRSKKGWASSRLTATIDFNNLHKVDWEAGWHFVRLLAQTEDGDLIPLADESGHPLPWAVDDEGAAAPRPNESDLFYVLTEVAEPPPPPQRAVQTDDSLEHARLRLQFSAVVDGRDPTAIAPQIVGWADRRHGPSSGSALLEAQFGRDGTVHIPVSRTLKGIEQSILAAPAGPVAWRVSVRMGQPDKPTVEEVRWPSIEECRELLSARQSWFDAVRAGASELVTQAGDLRSLRPLAVTYADAYQRLMGALLQRAEPSDSPEGKAALGDLWRMLTLDTVTVVVIDHRGHRREAALVAPTHPLRVLWFVAWAETGAQWLEAAGKGPPEHVVATRDALLRQLAPMGFPSVLATPGSPSVSGRLMTPIDNLTPHWTLYAPPYEPDPRGLLGEVCAAFGLPEPGIGGAIIDGEALATRVRRYLVQHPYIRTLVINAFNPGRAGLLAAMLLALQRQAVFADISYDIRLFVPDADAPGVGEGLAELLSPSGNLTGREVDAFATPSGDHLHPKLALGVRSVADFRAKPERFSAHLSFLFDLFPAEDVGATTASVRESAAPVHGLLQDYHVEYQEDDATIAWRRTPRHGSALPLRGCEELTDLLSSLPALLSNATSAVATGQAGIGMRPVIGLALDAIERALLHQVHEVSDWVLTLDRNMGIEFFDHSRRRDRPDYLIDHSVGVALGHRLTITSRSVAELEAMLVPVLKDYNLASEARHAVAVLDQLRSLSGRLALKLISAPAQRAEALGLALSRMYLEHQGAFQSQIAVPLDAHLELYRSPKQAADELGNEVSFKRTDLGLFDLDAAERTITCRLVEVKCYTTVGDLASYAALKDRIAAQIAQSQEILSLHFDPRRGPADRADRLLKTRELVTMLEFYLDRGVRYGTIGEQAAEEARFLLRSLEDGYRLVFTRSALVFDFEKDGTDTEHEHGIEFHRVGSNLIRELVEAAAPTPEERAATSETLESEVPAADRSKAELARRRRRSPGIPALETAAFLGTNRDRTVTRESLTSSAGRDGEESTPADVAPEHAEIPGAEAPSSSAAMRGEQESAQAAPPSMLEVPTPVPEPPGEEVAVAPVAALELFQAMQMPGSNPNEGSPEAQTAMAHGGAGGTLQASGPAYDVMLGVTGASPQYGILGEVSGRTVALDLNQTHTISLFGVQGGGKSYTLGSIAEMASLPIDGINRLPEPLATVIFHYSPTMDYAPEFTSMVAPNTDEAQVAMLRQRYGAEPRALSDVLLLVPADKLGVRQAELPGIEVRALQFAAAELQASHWRFLMGAVGNQATYIRQLNRIMKQLRDGLTLAGLRQGIDESRMPDHIKELAQGRLDLAAELIDDSSHLCEVIRPGRLVIVDLRDEFMEKDQALGLFVVLLQLFAEVTHEGRKFNKLVVFDEAHKYIESPDLIAGLVEVVREMRHKGTTIMVASQDPPSVPVQLIELSSQIILHRFNSPAWLKHIQKANAALGGLTPEKMAHLRPGEAFVWSSKATDEAFSQGAIKVRCRPRVTQHGGATKTAVRD